ncbi:MAG: hypothetical protein C5B58_14195, partial [Acidobacteria bacterium]
MKIDPLALPKPREPYRGILPFRLLDWRIFFEREAETQRLANLVSLYRGVLLYGQSGCGKSSLLNAGLVPQALRQGRAPERIRVYPEKGKELFIEPINLREADSAARSEDELPRYLPSRFIPSIDTVERVQLSCIDFSKTLRNPSDLGVPLLIFDQFEELVTLFEENPKDRDRVEEAREARGAIEELFCELLLPRSDPLPLKIVFAFRDDYLARLAPVFSRIPNLTDQAVRLPRPGTELLHQIVRGPFLPSKERGISAGDFGDELSEEIAQKIESGIRASEPSGVLNLSEVQTLCLALWRQPKLRDELLRATDTPAVLRKIIESEAIARLNQLRPWDRARAIAVLSNLVTEDGTRNVVSQEMLVSQTRRNPLLWFFRGDWHKFLSRLPKTGLVRRSLSSGTTYYYELASEFLIPRIQKWQRQLRRRRQIILGCICAVLVAVPWYEAHRAKKAEKAAIREAHRANKAEQAAIEEKESADELIGIMMYDLRDTLRKLSRLDVMDALCGLIEDYFKKHPPEASDLDRRREQAVAHLLRGDAYLDDGQLDEASERYDAALKIIQELVTKRPDNTTWQRDLAYAYLSLGALLRNRYDLPGALKSYQDSLAIVEKLVKQRSDNPDWRLDSVVYDLHRRIGRVLRDQGERTRALKSYRDSLAIVEKLVSQRPGTPDWQLSFAATYDDIGDVLREQGDSDEALKSFRGSLAIVEKLINEHPENAVLKYQAVICYERIGNVQRDKKDFAAALKSYSDSQATMKELVEHDPSNRNWRRDLAVTYEDIGNALHDQADWAGALKSFKSGLAINEELVEQNPGNVGWQWDRSDLYADIGKMLRDKGDLVGALKNYQNSLAIREKLASQNPSNAEWQAGLGWIYWQTGAM